MTAKEKAKEKAKELVDKMYVIHTHSASDYHFAIHCALIAVDEILEELSEVLMVIASSYAIKHIDFWQEVKQEIEKL